MLSLADIRAGFSGAIAIAQNQPDPMNRFDLTFEGFWKSFLAILVVIPALAIYMPAEWAIIAEQDAALNVTAERAVGRYIAVQVVVTAIDWLAFPLIVLLFARQLGIENKVAGYITAQNWTAALANLILVAPAILYAGGVVPGAIAGFMSLALFAFILHVFYKVARVALDAPFGLASGLVAFNALLSLTFGEIASRLI
ncbi:hypothetical protein ACKTEK_00370 [Tepidamorphus sp. 3E244]|uniref:hypothetical protein n=1 Tax=Tepidamorphus sp. 3E244 TaxID=3385498 RepID=UPI0038FC9841